MHEYSVAQALIERVEREARNRGAAAVRGLSIRVGELSGVDPSLLAAAYAAVREGTLCADAELSIETTPLRWECADCGRTLPPGGVLRCPTCVAAPRLVQGDELMLQRVELEVP